MGNETILERWRRTDELLVFAADMEPFATKRGDRFCILYPLMTLDGDPFESRLTQFPNRGRVWWMLRDEISTEEVMPGTLWMGKLEEAPQFDPHERKKDKYQVDKDHIHRVDKRVIEVIDLHNEPNISLVRESRPLAISRRRPPTPFVFLRGSDTVMGPLRAERDESNGTLFVEPAKPGSFDVLVLGRSDFEHVVTTREFSWVAGQHDQNGVDLPLHVCVTSEEWLDYEKMRSAGEIQDGTPDSQVVKWGAETAGLSRTETQEFRRRWEQICSLSPEKGEDKIQRLREMASHADRILDLGEGVAEALADSRAFKDLVEKHITRITEDRVRKRVQKHREEIEKEVSSQNKVRNELQKEIAELEDRYEEKSRRQKKRLEKENREFIRALEERESQLEKREVALEHQEEALVERLERASSRYQEESEAVADEFVTLLPLINRFIGTESPGEQAAPPRPGSAGQREELNLPAFLDEARQPAQQPLSEGEFIDQFERVCQRRGYVFETEDLINFHVCIKCGDLTVLAGRSGTGKSSLPRLYAEALGCEEEYLSIPVRPDWLDDRDLMGAFNALSQRFEPANSGLVDRLIAAHVDRSRERGGIYLVCLDEMNLARVEHYFARFLSVLEEPQDKRRLPLFSGGLGNPEDPYNQYRLLPLGENVRFVGTVNIDETTHFFSPKVLDRSRTISFGEPDLSEWHLTSDSDSVGGLIPVSFERYSSWVVEPEDSEECMSFLREVNGILDGSRLGFRYRQLEHMLHYVAASRPFFSSDQALDFQLLQIVLPRLRRTAPRFDRTLSDLRELVTAKRFPRSADMLERIAEARPEDEFFQLL